MSNLHSHIAVMLKDEGGHLECNVCHATQSIGDVAAHLQSGWPKCCGYTMTWITAAQERSPNHAK